MTARACSEDQLAEQPYRSAPNTFLMMSVPAPTGSLRILNASAEDYRARSPVAARRRNRRGRART